MRCTRFLAKAVLFAAALLIIQPVPVNAQGRAVKISVKPDKRTVQVGESFRIEVALSDVANAPVSAPKDFQISLDILFPSGRTNRQTLAIRRGQSAASISVSLTEPGINRLRAVHPELREGGGSVMVRARQQTSPRALQQRPRRTQTQSSTPTRELVVPAPPPRRPASPRPATTRTRGLIGRPRSIEETTDSEAASRAPGLTATESVATSNTEAIVVDTQGDIPTPPSVATLSPAASTPLADAGSAVLEFDYSPQRKLLADGRDGATISAFLTPGSDFDREVEVQLHNSDGTLEPRVLRFPRGEWVADSVRTAERN